MKKSTKKTTKKKGNPLAIAAGVVLILALGIWLVPKVFEKDQGEAPQEAAVSTGSDLRISKEEIGTSASYYDYDAGGVTVEVLAVKASDDTVRLALNTCQVCNGSPYAYFVQEGDDFVCQNCHNRFSSTDVGKVSGGCNPVPITSGTYEEENGTLIIPAAFLEENASRFKNWKKF